VTSETRSTLIGVLMGDAVKIDDRIAALVDLGFTACADRLDHDEWPVHRPAAPEAPIPGTHWYSGCDPDRPRVNPLTSRCEGCNALACRVCGREQCPDHAPMEALA
jgi:hypothetical protein